MRSRWLPSGSAGWNPFRTRCQFRPVHRWQECPPYPCLASDHLLPRRRSKRNRSCHRIRPVPSHCWRPHGRSGQCPAQQSPRHHTRCQHRRGSGRASIHLASQRHSGAGLRPEGPAASHGSGGAVRCPFGRVVRTRRAQVARLGRCSSALLHHVRKLVGDQLSTLARIRGDVFAPDDDISSRRVGHCAHALGGMCSPRPGVYSHLAEVVTEAGFHERSDTCVERLARRGYYLLNDGRRSSLSSVLCVAARLLQARDRMYLVAARRYCAWSCEVTRLFPRRSLVFLCVCMHLFSTLVHASRPKR